MLAVAAVTAVGVVGGPVAPTQAAPDGDVTVEETTLNDVSGRASGIATCPPGRRVVGGGVGTTAAVPESRIHVSGPLDETGTTANTVDGDVARSWYALVQNYGDSKTYKVFALCSAASDATIEETATTLLPGAQGSAVATCPVGRRVVGGGVGTTATKVDSAVQASGPLDESGATADTVDGDVPRHWYASLWNSYNHDGPVGQTYKVFALCSATSDATIEETTMAMDGHFASGVATCPPGRRALGGGVGTTAASVSSTVVVSGPLDATGTTADTADGDVSRRWYANVFSPTQGTFKVFALCAGDDGATPGGPGTDTSAGSGPGAGPGGAPGGAGAGPGGPGSEPTRTTSRAFVCGGRRATIVGSPRADKLRGTPRRDVIAGLGGNDTIRGLGGNDIICGGGGRDTLLGGTGADDLRGGAGNDTLRGDTGSDVLRGEIGADRLVGGPGRDRLLGGPGRDRQIQ